MLVLALILIPLAGAIACFLPMFRAREKALLFSGVNSIAGFYALKVFNDNQFDLLIYDAWWVRDLGISFSINLDGISMLLVLLTNVLVPLIVLSSFRNNHDRPSVFYSLILLMQAALIGVFTAADGFLFYIFWELALIPVYLICLMWGGEQRARITLKFFIYTLSGSLLMLIGTIALYLQTPAPHSFAIEDLYNVVLSQGDQKWIFWMFFIAFAVKIPVFPLHTWQPDTYTDAPPQGTMLLAGIMLKMGTYGIIRWILPLFPLAIDQYGTVIMFVAVAGVIYASVIALMQDDFKRMLAYSSLAHAGLIAVGIFALNVEALQGAMMQMIAHGINITGLFFVADIIQRRMKTRSLTSLGGIANNSPVFTILFLIILLAAIALPLTNGFVGEFLLLTGIYAYSPAICSVAVLSVILGAVYMLRSYQKIMLGEQQSKNNEFTGLHSSEKAVLIIIVIIIIATGIYPKPLLAIAEPALQEILNHMRPSY